VLEAALLLMLILYHWYTSVKVLFDKETTVKNKPSTPMPLSLACSVVTRKAARPFMYVTIQDLYLSAELDSTETAVEKAEHEDVLEFKVTY
jgi:hypothetical protein